MSNFIDNVMLLNKESYSKQVLITMTKELMNQRPFEWPKKAVLYYNPNEKWVGLFCNFLCVPYDSKENAELISRLFDTTVVCNQVYASDAILMALAGKHTDLYIYGYLDPDIQPRDMNVEKWMSLIECTKDEFVSILKKDYSLQEDRLEKLGIALGFNVDLLYCSYDNLIENMSERKNDLSRYEVIKV